MGVPNASVRPALPELLTTADTSWVSMDGGRRWLCCRRCAEDHQELDALVADLSMVSIWNSNGCVPDRSAVDVCSQNGDIPQMRFVLIGVF